MKIKKFYYYSPEKLKLIQVQNFIPKAVVGVTSILVIFIIATIIISNEVVSGKFNQIFNSDEFKQKNLLKSELVVLKEKYQLLSNKFEQLNKENNTIRLAVNLPSLEDNSTFGIGGSEFKSFWTDSFEKRKEHFNSIYNYVNKIETSIKIETSSFSEIEEKFTTNKELFEVIPALKPVKASIGDRFGLRYHPILKQRKMHYGLDFLANTGEKVFAPGDGVVSFVGEVGGYGKVVKIQHGFGYVTLYGHLSKYKVKKGDQVKRGNVIAETGNSGKLSTGPHLHYEIRHNGVSLNPRNFIFEDVKLFDAI